MLQRLAKAPTFRIGDPAEGFNGFWLGLDVELCVTTRSASAGWRYRFRSARLAALKPGCAGGLLHLILVRPIGNTRCRGNPRPRIEGVEFGGKAEVCTLLGHLPTAPHCPTSAALSLASTSPAKARAFSCAFSTLLTAAGSRSARPPP